MNILVNIAISAVTLIATAFGVYNYVPMDWLGLDNDYLGVSVTEISSSDKMSDFPTTYNANLNALNDGKVENATTSMASITTLANLTTVGTIGTGTWQADTIAVSYGGTGSTTLSQYSILMGSSTNPISTVSGLGTSGQFLTSGGAGTPPTWTTSALAQGDDYNWTGTYFGVKNLNASSTVANPIILNTVSYNTPTSDGASSTLLYTDGSGGLTWNNPDWQQIGETILGSGNATTSVTVEARKDLRIIISIVGVGGSDQSSLCFNGDCGSANNYGVRFYENAAETVASDIKQIALNPSSTASAQYYTVDIVNETSLVKLVRWQGASGVSGSTAPSFVEGIGSWDNTASQITQIDLRTDNANAFSAGTRLTVYAKRD